MENSTSEILWLQLLPDQLKGGPDSEFQKKLRAKKQGATAPVSIALEDGAPTPMGMTDGGEVKMQAGAYTGDSGDRIVADKVASKKTFVDHEGEYYCQAPLVAVIGGPEAVEEVLVDAAKKKIAASGPAPLPPSSSDTPLPIVSQNEKAPVMPQSEIRSSFALGGEVVDPEMSGTAGGPAPDMAKNTYLKNMTSQGYKYDSVSGMLSDAAGKTYSINKDPFGNYSHTLTGPGALTPSKPAGSNISQMANDFYTDAAGAHNVPVPDQNPAPTSAGSGAGAPLPILTPDPKKDEFINNMKQQGYTYNIQSGMLEKDGQTFRLNRDPIGNYSYTLVAGAGALSPGTPGQHISGAAQDVYTDAGGVHNVTDENRNSANNMLSGHSGTEGGFSSGAPAPIEPSTPPPTEDGSADAGRGSRLINKGMDFLESLARGDNPVLKALLEQTLQKYGVGTAAGKAELQMRLNQQNISAPAADAAMEAYLRGARIGEQKIMGESLAGQQEAAQGAAESLITTGQAERSFTQSNLQTMMATDLANGNFDDYRLHYKQAYGTEPSTEQYQTAYNDAQFGTAQGNIADALRANPALTLDSPKVKEWLQRMWQYSGGQGQATPEWMTKQLTIIKQTFDPSWQYGQGLSTDAIVNQWFGGRASGDNSLATFSYGTDNDPNSPTYGKKLTGEKAFRAYIPVLFQSGAINYDDAAGTFSYDMDNPAITAWLHPEVPGQVGPNLGTQTYKVSDQFGGKPGFDVMAVNAKGQATRITGTETDNQGNQKTVSYNVTYDASGTPTYVPVNEGLSANTAGPVTYKGVPVKTAQGVPVVKRDGKYYAGQQVGDVAMVDGKPVFTPIGMVSQAGAPLKAGDAIWFKGAALSHPLVNGPLNFVSTSGTNTIVKGKDATGQDAYFIVTPSADGSSVPSVAPMNDATFKQAMTDMPDANKTAFATSYLLNHPDSAEALTAVLSGSGSAWNGGTRAPFGDNTGAIAYNGSGASVQLSTGSSGMNVDDIAALANNAFKKTGDVRILKNGVYAGTGPMSNLSLTEKDFLAMGAAVAAINGYEKYIADVVSKIAPNAPKTTVDAIKKQMRTNLGVYNLVSIYDSANAETGSTRNAISLT